MSELDEAWSEVEAALPEGWRLSGLTSAGFWPQWLASAMTALPTADQECDHGIVHRGKREHASAIGLTPESALRDLAGKLREVVA